jgi:hypothetical protein
MTTIEVVIIDNCYVDVRNLNGKWNNWHWSKILDW